MQEGLVIQTKRRAVWKVPRKPVPLVTPHVFGASRPGLVWAACPCVLAELGVRGPCVCGSASLGPSGPHHWLAHWPPAHFS